MAMSWRQDILYLQGRKFHHPQRLLLLLQRETPPGLIMLVQMLTRMDQSGKENVYMWCWAFFLFVFIILVGFYFYWTLVRWYQLLSQSDPGLSISPFPPCTWLQYDVSFVSLPMLSLHFPTAGFSLFFFLLDSTWYTCLFWNLQEVSSMLLEKLVAAGIGNRPVVFVTHRLV